MSNDAEKGQAPAPAGAYVTGAPVAPAPYQAIPGTAQSAYIAPPGTYPAQPVAYPAAAPAMIVAPQPVFIQQQQKPSGYHEGTCSCGSNLGAAHWTCVAWILCLCFCPFNFCYPYCMPETRRCQSCGKVYYKP
ncbi:hypothetical protein PLESTM_001354500 [Pleodorina starrii]|nr:hypothetical protein PLESTM_001354500 [Pleodorina starrii]